jgi:hypothetical protein
MTLQSESTKDLEQMNLGATSVRIGPILPVDQENVH